MDTGKELDRSQRRSVVDNAIYVDGRRTDDPANLDETYDLLRQRRGMAWIGLYRPTRDEILSVAPPPKRSGQIHSCSSRINLSTRWRI